MSDRLRVAVVGCGAISEMHLLGIREGAPRTDVVAAVDVDAERATALAARTGARTHLDLDEALAAGGFEAVLLLLPHHLHEAAALRCFEAGKHVLLEKPMAPDVAACQRILAAAEAAGTVFMVGENAQYWPEVVAAERRIAEGAIGEVVTARASIFFPPLASYYGGARPWRFDLAASGGGIAIDTGSHWIRPLRMWLGEVDEVVGALGRPFAAMEGESLVRALLRFRSGAVASFDALLTEAPLAPELLFRITGSAGELTIDGLGRSRIYDGGDPKGRPAAEPGGYLRSYAGELADFEGAVLDGTPLAASAAHAVGELRTALALYRSARTGRWEQVWD